MDLTLAIMICLVGGIVGGLVGVGGGAIFVPAMTLILGLGQVEAEATSLLIIALVAVAGTWRQSRFGNVNLKDAAVIGLLSPVGVLAGVVLANSVPERALRVGFGILVFYLAWRLLRPILFPGPAVDGSSDPGQAGGPEGPEGP